MAAVAATTAAIAEEALDADRGRSTRCCRTSSTSRRRWRRTRRCCIAYLFTQGVEPTPTKPSNIAKRSQFALGDVDAGLRRGRGDRRGGATPPRPCTRAISSPMPASPPIDATARHRSGAAARASSWCAPIRAKLLGIDISNIRVTPAEIGGGFGGKTLVYLEPVALALSRKAGRPVKMVMSREEVFRASGPTSGGAVEVKIGAKKDGTITAAEATLKYQAGAFAGSPVGTGLHGGLRLLRPQERHASSARTWSATARRSAAYRAPGAPIAAFGVESVHRRTGAQDRHGPDRRPRRRTRPQNGTKAAYGPTFQDIGYRRDPGGGARTHPHYQPPLGPNQGRGVASGFWFNFGGESTRGCPHQRGRHRRGGRPATPTSAARARRWR